MQCVLHSTVYTLCQMVRGGYWIRYKEIWLKIIFHHRERERSFHFRRRTVANGKWESPNWRWFTLLCIRKVRKIGKLCTVCSWASSLVRIIFDVNRHHSWIFAWISIRRSTITHYVDYSGYFKQSIGSCACTEKTLYKRNTKFKRKLDFWSFFFSSRSHRLSVTSAWDVENFKFHIVVAMRVKLCNFRHATEHLFW